MAMDSNEDSHYYNVVLIVYRLGDGCHYTAHSCEGGFMIGYVRLAAVAAAVLVGIAFAGPANAQASRTWISGVGDDANPCSRTAPCKTFAGAISKTAAGGEIDCLDPGGFGAVTITKSITLDCGGGIGGQVGSILASGTNGVNISAGASDRVKIRNMSINGFNGAGLAAIKFNTGSSLTIEHVGIFGFGASSVPAVDFVPTAAGSKLTMRDVEVQNNNSAGIFIGPVSGVAASAVLENVASIGNTTIGLNVADGASVTASNSTFSDNAGKGVLASSAGGTVNVFLDSNTIAGNGTQGVQSIGASSTVRLSNNGIYGNGTGLQSTSSGAIISFQNNRNAGNGTAGAPTGTAALQ